MVVSISLKRRRRPGGLDGGRQRLRRRDRHRPGASPAPAGLGGDAFVVLYNAAEGRPYAVNGGGVAPGATSRERFTSRGLTTMPLSGLDSASVPGAPDAYWTVHQRFGSLLARLCEPAIRYAEEGLAVSPPAPHHLRLQSQAGAVRLLQRRLLPRWRAPAVGSLYRRPAYGRSLRLLAGGPGRLLPGAHRRRDGALLPGAGGLFSAEDFAAHRTEVYEPLRTTYRGVEVCETAPRRACWCWRC